MQHFFSHAQVLQRAEAYALIIAIVVLTAILAEIGREHALPELHTLLSQASNALMHFITDVAAAEVGAKSLGHLFVAE